MDRGECPFTDKGIFAQYSDAAGIIIINNVEGEINEVPGGTIDPPLTIPVIYISQEDGKILKEIYASSCNHDNQSSKTCNNDNDAFKVRIQYDSKWRAYNSIKKGEKLMLKNRNDVSTALGLVYAYGEIGDYEDKVLMYLDLISREGKTFLKGNDFNAAMLQLGLKFVQTGKVKEALELITEETLDNYQYFNEIGSEYVHLGYIQEGRKMLKKAKDLDPRSFIKHLDLGNFYVKSREKFEKINREFSSFLAVFPTHLEARDSFVNYLLEKKPKSKILLENLKELVYFHKRNNDRFKLGDIYMDLKQFELASFEFQAILNTKKEVLDGEEGEIINEIQEKAQIKLEECHLQISLKDKDEL